MQLLTEIDDFERQVWQNASGSAAKLRFAQACVEDVDFAAARDLVDGCSSNSPPASGSKLPEPVYHRRLRHRQKTWLACALGHNAARAEFTVLYQLLPRRFADLAFAPRR
jgi:hypothetical protein